MKKNFTIKLEKLKAQSVESFDNIVQKVSIMKGAGRKREEKNYKNI